MFVEQIAQAVGGKLYILGGGWDRLMVPSLPGKPILPLYLAMGILVPYHLTNTKFELASELHDASGQLVGERFSPPPMEAGRPPGIRVGTPQRLPIAVGINPEFPSTGTYSFRTFIDNEPMADVQFEVDGPPQSAFSG